MRDEDSFDACCRCSERDQGPECRPHLFRFHVLDCPGRFPVDRRCRHQRHQGIIQWPLPWPHCVIMRHFASDTPCARCAAPFALIPHPKRRSEEGGGEGREKGEKEGRGSNVMAMEDAHRCFAACFWGGQGI